MTPPKQTPQQVTLRRKRQKRELSWMCPCCLYEFHELSVADCRRKDKQVRDYEKLVAEAALRHARGSR